MHCTQRTVEFRRLARVLYTAFALLAMACTALPPPTAETCASRPSASVVRLTHSWRTGTPACPPFARDRQECLSSTESLRLLLIGDSGEKNAISAAIFEAAGPLRPDAILLLGDNFYECGLDSPERWRDYEPLIKHGIPIYPVLGNHDHGCPYGSADPSPQLRDNGVWRFPARNYALEFGSLADFLFIDTTPIAEGWRDSDDVLCLARGALTGTSKRWRFVVGHHPLYGSGGHAISFWSEPRRMRALRSILEKAGVSAYLAGHDHHLELVRKNDIAYLVSGSASRLRRALPMRHAEFREARHGFAELEITKDRVRIRFHRVDGSRCCDATQWFDIAGGQI